ncbi:MAG: type IV pili methyl-accepting chemotaxis transducer N-terminal domain-containing protein, partial [Burkholderiaceae bacterium]
MSELNLFQKLFKRKSVASAEDVALMPSFESTKAVADSAFSTSTTTASMATAVPNEEFTHTAAGLNADVTTADDGDAAVLTGDLISIPLLGKRTVVAHQRILAALLALALIILALVTFFALTQADKVTQQLSATGQALMQSQRLAKSVSQAIVGTPQAFPDVKESADVLAKSVRALKSGDEQMRIDAVPVEAQVSVDLIS